MSRSAPEHLYLMSLRALGTLHLSARSAPGTQKTLLGFLERSWHSIKEYPERSGTLNTEYPERSGTSNIDVPEHSGTLINNVPERYGNPISNPPNESYLGL